MKTTSFAIMLALTLIATGCRRDPVATGLGGESQVSATKVATGIRITNHTDRGVAYAVSNPTWLGLLAICNDPEPACVRLARGASVIVPFSEIHGYAEGTTTSVRVAWWHVVPDGEGQYKATDPVEILVQL